jgi:hypothetical protein
LLFRIPSSVMTEGKTPQNPTVRGSSWLRLK